VSTPIQRHALLVSEEPPSAEPRRILTAADGTASIRLRPGTFVVESDVPVGFNGRAYVWRQVVEIMAGRDASLDLTLDNAEVVPLSELPPPEAVRDRRDNSPSLDTSHESAVVVWSPTAKASGFVVDSRGLIATDGRAVGAATVVEVQLTPELKVLGHVLLPRPAREMAIVRVNPSVVVNHPVFACPPAQASALDDGRAICAAVAASVPKLAGAEPPPATRLPVDPVRPYPASALETPKPGTTPNPAVPVMSSSDFDVAFITPPMVHRARLRAGWTGGPPNGRSPEAEQRLGRLTEFGAWSEYFSDLPPVLIVRATPKMVEGFWKRLGREAARTQGAVLPAFKDFKTNFRHMRATCGGVEVTPIHPFVLEHQINEKNVIREGLFVFDAGAIGPQCGTVTLSFYSETQPERADTITVTRTIIDQLWNDFAPYRQARAPATDRTRTHRTG
jgi:hypothetical protein